MGQNAAIQVIAQICIYCEVLLKWPGWYKQAEMWFSAPGFISNTFWFYDVTQYFRKGASGEQKLWTLHEKCPHNLQLFVYKKKTKTKQSCKYRWSWAIINFTGLLIDVYLLVISLYLWLYVITEVIVKSHVFCSMSWEDFFFSSSGTWRIIDKLLLWFNYISKSRGLYLGLYLFLL